MDNKFSTISYDSLFQTTNFKELALMLSKTAYPNSLSKIINQQSTLIKLAKASHTNSFTSMNKLLDELYALNTVNNPSETYKFLSNYMSNYYKLSPNASNLFNKVIVKSLQNPDKLNNFLSKSIDKRFYNNDINSSSFAKEPKIKNTYNIKNVTNYNIDTVNITYQVPTSKEFYGRFDKSPDSIRNKNTSNKSAENLQTLFTFLIILFNSISQLPGAVEGSKMIYNVLKNILYYLN